RSFDAPTYPSLTVSPDGKYMALGGNSGALLDLTTGNTLFRLGGGVPAFSPDSKHLAYGGPDGTVRLWDVATGKEVQPLMGHRAAITSLAFTPDAQQLVTASKDGSARQWDIVKRTELVAFEEDNRLAIQGHQVGSSPDGARVAWTPGNGK